MTHGTGRATFVAVCGSLVCAGQPGNVDLSPIETAVCTTHKVVRAVVLSSYSRIRL